MQTQAHVPAQAPSEPKPPSTVWYIAPYVGALLLSVFGAAIGGIVGWAVVKDRDAAMGRKILVPHTVIAVGIAILATVVLWLAVFGTLFVAGEAARQVAANSPTTGVSGVPSGSQNTAPNNLGTSTPTTTAPASQATSPSGIPSGGIKTPVDLGTPGSGYISQDSSNTCPVDQPAGLSTVGPVISNLEATWSAGAQTNNLDCYRDVSSDLAPRATLTAPTPGPATQVVALDVPADTPLTSGMQVGYTVRNGTATYHVTVALQEDGDYWQWGSYQRDS